MSEMFLFEMFTFDRRISLIIDRLVSEVTAL